MRKSYHLFNRVSVFRLALTLLSFGLVAAIWEVAAWNQWYAVELFPPPHRLLTALLEGIISGELFADLKASLIRYLGGLSIGAMVGVATGLLTGRSQFFHDTVGSLLNFCRSTPAIALIPLAIVWLGIGEGSKVFVIAWGATFPVWISTHAGVAEVEREYVWAAQTLGVQRWRMYYEVFLPRALPYIVSGARIAVATGFFALAAAEMAGAYQGVAFRIFQSHSMFRNDKMLVAIIVIGCIGLLSDRVFVAVARRFVPWWKPQGSELRSNEQGSDAVA
jgi:ABC-type nitrate/sulfonate/bicarbonate transport system permease component